MSGFQPVQYVKSNPKSTGVIAILIVTIIIMALVWAFAYQRNASDEEDEKEIVGKVTSGGKCVAKPKLPGEKCVKGLSCIEGVCGVGTESSESTTGGGGGSKYKSCPTILSGATCEWKDYENLKDGVCFAKYKESSSGNCGKSEAQAQCSRFGTWIEDSSNYLCKQGTSGSGGGSSGSGGGSSGSGGGSSGSGETIQPPVNNCTITDLIKSDATCGWANSGPNKCITSPFTNYCNSTNAKNECKGTWILEPDNKFGCAKSKVGQPCMVGGVAIGNYVWKDDTTCQVLERDNSELNACCNRDSNGFCTLSWPENTSSSTINNWINACKERTSTPKCIPPNYTCYTEEAGKKCIQPDNTFRVCKPITGAPVLGGVIQHSYQP